MHEPPVEAPRPPLAAPQIAAAALAAQADVVPAPPAANADDAPVEAEKPTIAAAARAGEGDVSSRPIDVSAALAQPIRQYELSRPVAFGSVLQEIEDMAGVPIQLDQRRGPISDELIGKPVTVPKLQNTTIGGILDALMLRVDLKYEARADGVVVFRRPAH
jgi:hypothetical protein